MVIQETNFIASFSKVGYLCLKAILVNHQVGFKKYTITQASQVKEYWEKLEWEIEKVTILSIDTVAMHPSIKFTLVKKEITFYTKNLPKHATKN